jgi:hydrocephalus-inducing protein
VTFRPLQAYTYKSYAFCNISCSEKRLQLELTGEGRGPKAELVTGTEKDIGDIYINETVKDWITIDNVGQIECHFKLLENNTPFSKAFDFRLKEYPLAVDEKL